MRKSYVLCLYKINDNKHLCDIYLNSVLVMVVQEADLCSFTDGRKMEFVSWCGNGGYIRSKD